MTGHYYHMFANGDDAKDFIISEEDFKAAMNRVAVSAHLCGVTILAASIEDTHPHILLYADEEGAVNFKDTYEDLSVRYISRHRGSCKGVTLACELSEINDESYLMNAAIYVITQATKDGKPVMPYDYLYGTGALYFRKPGSILPWDHDYHGGFYKQEILGSLPLQKQWKICNTKTLMPGKWIVVNGFIHPKSYVDVSAYEMIFKTHNCFRAFMSGGKNRDEAVRMTMSAIRGVTLEDIEARKICQDRCADLFGKMSTRQLSTEQRLSLAIDMRKRYKISIRQLSILTKLPENEIRKYIR